MKQGAKVSFYTTRTAFNARAGREKEYTKQYTGTVISFDEYQAYVLPDGKTKAILLPINQVREI